MLSLNKSKVYPNPVAQRTPWYMDTEEVQQQYMSMAPENIKQYVYDFITDGVVVVQDSLPLTECKNAISDFRSLIQRNEKLLHGLSDEDGLFYRVVNVHQASDVIRNAFLNNKALQVVEYLFGEKPALYSSLYYERGSQQDIHRDTPYFCTNPGHFYLGFWVALEDANADNGALSVIKGGHKLREGDLTDLVSKKYSSNQKINPFDADLWNWYQEKVMQMCEDNGLTPETIEVGAGSTVIWHPELPHGGGKNTQGNTRHSFVGHLTPVGVPVYHQDVFFDPQNKASLSTNWRYQNYKHAYIRDEKLVDFAHKKQFKAGLLKESWFKKIIRKV